MTLFFTSVVRWPSGSKQSMAGYVKCCVLILRATVQKPIMRTVNRKHLVLYLALLIIII